MGHDRKRGAPTTGQRPEDGHLECPTLAKPRSGSLQLYPSRGFCAIWVLIHDSSELNNGDRCGELQIDRDAIP